MRVPDFLIIGAMKSGTTTLHEDLLTHPGLFAPLDKEPENLLADDVLTESGRAAYASLFAAARPEQRCFESSTTYSKLPDLPGVPERARSVCGPELRVIYVVREPVARIVSQHHHVRATGRIAEPIDEAVRKHPMFLDWSRYAMQIEPWIDVFGPERVLVVRFETFVADRAASIGDVQAFVGVDPRPELVQVERVANRSAGKPVHNVATRLLAGNPVYRRVLRPALGPRVRERRRRARSSRAAPAAERPAPSTVDWILAETAGDRDRLARLMGLDGPVWDEAAIRDRYGAAAAEPAT